MSEAALIQEQGLTDSRRHISGIAELEHGQLPQMKEFIRTEQAIKAILREFGEKDPIHVPDAFTLRVGQFIKIYNNPKAKRAWFTRALKRLDRHHPMVSGIFQKKHLPNSLHYLALVESAYVPHARSSAGAVGMWQFMKGTARDYNLKVSRTVDERKDPHKSTVAASEYLTDLILEFGHGESMLLAMAAYNAGEGRVRSELRRLSTHKQRGFWSLVEKGKYLRTETKNYVPQIIAAAVIGNSRSQYGFAEPVPVEDSQELLLHSPVPIAYILKHGNLSREELLRYNPDIRSSASKTPAGMDYRLLLPKNSAALLMKKRLMLSALSSTKEQTVSYLRYQVKPGNTLGTIARAFGTSVTAIKAFNKGQGNRIYAGQKLTIPVAGWQRITVRVKPGDSLSKIALRFRISTKALKTYNGIKGFLIKPGEELVIYKHG